MLGRRCPFHKKDHIYFDVRPPTLLPHYRRQDCQKSSHFRSPLGIIKTLRYAVQRKHRTPSSLGRHAPAFTELKLKELKPAVMRVLSPHGAYDRESRNALHCTALHCIENNTHKPKRTSVRDSLSCKYTTTTTDSFYTGRLNQ